jgi:hypothetical protein
MSEQSQSPLNREVTKELHKLYRRMKTGSIETERRVSSIEKSSVQEISLLTLPSPTRIRKIHSLTSNNKESPVPNRPAEIYQKLGLYYKRKHEDKVNRKKNSLIDRFARIDPKIARKIKSASPEKATILRVPSLLININ